MSEELTQTQLSNEQVVETPAETTAPTETAAPVQTESEQIFSQLESQFSDPLEKMILDAERENGEDETEGEVSTDVSQAEETTEEVVEAENEDDYDPQQLYNEYSGHSSEVETLRETVNRLQEQVQQLQKAPSGNATQQQDKPLQLYQFVTPEEYEAAMSSPEAFNRLMNRVYYSALEHAVSRSGEVSTQVHSKIMNAQRAVDDYYESNPQLKQNRKRHEELMGLVWPKVVSENPGKGFNELLSEAGKRTNEILNMRAQKKGQLRAPKGTQPQRPAFARPSGGGGGRGGQPAEAVPRRGFSW